MQTSQVILNLWTVLDPRYRFTQLFNKYYYIPMMCWMLGIRCEQSRCGSCPPGIPSLYLRGM